MVTGSVIKEFKSRVSASRMWKATVVDINNLLPKIAPHFISSMEVIEGNGGAGSIVLTKFAEAIKGIKVVKTQIVEMDEDNLSYKYAVVEGKLDVFKTVCYGYKYEVEEDGGCLCKISTEYSTVGDAEPTEEEKGVGSEAALNTLKGIEAYLLGAPDAYN